MPHVQLDQMPTAETAASSSSTSWMQNRAAARGLPAVSSSPPPSSATSTSSSPALAPTLTLGSLPTPLLGSLEQSKTLPIASTFSTTTSAATAALTRDKLVRIGVAEPCSTPDVKGKNREKGLDEEEEREMKSCVLVSAPPAPLVYNPATGGSNGNGYGKGQLHASSSSSSTAALSDPQLARFGQSRDAATAEMAADPTALRSQAEEEGQSATDLLLKDNNASSSAADSDPFSILTVFSNAAAAATSSSHSHSKTSTTSASSLPQQAAAQVNAGQAPLESTPLVPPTTRKLCIRHQRMADEGTTAKLQKSIEKLPLADQRAVNSVWSIFSSSSHARRALILQGILTMCCFSQLSFLSSELSVAIRIDPFSLFPREVSLRVLGFTDAITLGRAAQVSRSWKALADDDMLWRNMCEQHIERKCEKCGWGLPLLNDKKRRRKVPPPGFQVQALSQVDSNWKNPVSTVESNAEGTQVDATQPEARGSAAEHNATGGSLKRSITAAANAAALEKKSLTSTPASPNVSRPPTSASDDCGRAAKRARTGDATQGGDNLTRSSTAVVPVAAAAKQANGAVTMTMPWKSVYCERLMIERNWRGGRYNVRTLQGHTDGIMCLQFNESLTSPQFPILITGSYDRTARVWNLDTGKELRVLKGHTRGVRCLQFDEMKLITGSMDRTLKIWNWRTGELMRTLEGHTAGIVCLHFNDEILASGSQDSNINVWNFRSGECFTLKGHQDWINAVHLWSGVKPAPPPVDIQNGPDGSAPATTAPMTFLFSASDDCSIRLWDLQTRERLMTYEGHVGQVQSIKLVMLDDDAVRKLIRGSVGGPGAERADAERFGREETRRTDHGGPLDPDASRQQQRSTSAERRSYQQQREQREARSGTEHESVPPLDRSALWDYNPPNVPGGRLPGTNRPDLPDRFYTSAASTGASNFNRASTSSSTGYFRAEEELAQAEATMHAHNDHETIPPHLLHLQERLSAAGLVPPLPFDAELSDIDSGLFAPEDEAHQHQAPPSRPAPDAQRDRARNGIRSEGSGSSSKRSYSRSPNRQRPCARPRPVLISGSLDNTLKIWDIRTGRCIRTLFGHIEGVWGVDVDKLRIVSASHDKTIKIWDRDTALCQNTLVGHTAAVTCIGLGDDKIISGSDDSEIKVWSFSPDS